MCVLCECPCKWDDDCSCLYITCDSNFLVVTCQLPFLPHNNYLYWSSSLVVYILVDVPALAHTLILYFIILLIMWPEHLLFCIPILALLRHYVTMHINRGQDVYTCRLDFLAVKKGHLYRVLKIVVYVAGWLWFKWVYNALNFRPSIQLLSSIGSYSNPPEVVVIVLLEWFAVLLFCWSDMLMHEIL